ncbi:DUF779 domain-containing protein [Mycobacterium sp.]|uniref:DUF779 domain-containing protein n=1 Tax=Mycobacterium sp. TaxID=1785 RepID=UPI003A87FE77
MNAGAPPGALITADAAELLATLQLRHGPVMFHQSGGCCDGSSPMCYPRSDFVVGDRDVLLGMLDLGSNGGSDDDEAAVPVWISGPQYETWKHTQLVIDVVAGRGGGFSLEAPEGVRFLSRGRVFTEAEQRLLHAVPVITGAGYQRGERPSVRGGVVRGGDPDNAPGACPKPVLPY